MLKNISITFIYKVLNAMLGFVNTVLITQFLGADGKGTLTIYMSNLSLILLTNNIIGGKSIIYLNNKISNAAILLPCYLWAFTGSILSAFILSYFNINESIYFVPLLIMSILYGLYNTNTMITLGKEEALKYNFLAILPTILQVIISIYLFYVQHNFSIISFISYQYIVYAISFIVSILFIKPYIQIPNKITVKGLAFLWNIGFKSQFSNIIQFLNNRVMFYLLGFYLIKNELGVYSVAVALTEVILILSNSISMVAFAKIANTESIDEINNIIKPYIKISFGITSIGLLCLLICPNIIYIKVFGTEFYYLKQAIIYLIPGTLAMSLYYVGSSYFNGIANFKINNFASIISLSILLILGFTFIPKGNILITAAITSLAFCSMSAFVFYKFAKSIKLTFKDCLFSKNDFVFLNRKPKY